MAHQDAERYKHIPFTDIFVKMGQLGWSFEERYRIPANRRSGTSGWRAIHQGGRVLESDEPKIENALYDFLAIAAAEVESFAARVTLIDLTPILDEFVRMRKAPLN